MQRSILAGLLVFVLSGTIAASAAPKSRAPKPRVAGPSVCVVTTIGHTFRVQKIGLMVFGNALDRVAIDSWGIDSLVVRKVGAVLGKPVRRLTIPQAAIAAYEKPGGGLFRNPKKELLDTIRATAAKSGHCRFYVVVTTGTSGYAGTNQTVTGLGILQHSAVFGVTYLYAIYWVEVYDGTTFERLQGKLASTEPILLASIPGMSRRVDESWWPATPKAAVGSAQLRNATRALVEQGLAAALPGML
jgi:hypothetical protein